MSDIATLNRGDFRLEDHGYQAVHTPALDEKHSSGVATDPADSTEDLHNRKKWQNLLRERLGKWMKKIHKRSFPRIEMRLNATTSIWGRDPAMDQGKLSEQVPLYMLIIVSLAIAIVVNLTINYVLPMFIKIRVITHDFRDFLLSLGQAITLSTFLVNFMKNMTGRFRPCFYDMCGWNYDVVWDGVTDLCSDSDGDDEGRKSFPSGHSSFAWSVMSVLTLYLLGRARLTSAEQISSILQEGVRTFKLFFCFLPCLGAAWVAITRSTDNRHHYSDIVAGSVVGAAAACLAYNHNYGSIYSWEMAGLPWETIHERKKAKLHDAVSDSQMEEGVANSAENVFGMINRAGSTSSKVVGER